jgi:hypothetical protein
MQTIPDDDQTLGGLTGTVAPNPDYPALESAIDTYLTARGFARTRQVSTTDRITWYSRLDGTEENCTRHSVAVWPDGHWDYSTEGLHSGFSFSELQAAL